MNRAFWIFSILIMFVSPATLQAKNGSRHGVTIVSCVVNSNGNNSTNGINVVYYNTHDSPATEVDFMVNYGGHKYILIDHGSFSRGAQINHNLTNALTGEPWDGPQPKLCVVKRVTLADGSVY
ncbi:MAG TPA: hypothetical protein VKE42_04425 [Candidatus Cybelea sp.]|nr:hypothetical protein [Candidatus Cybelea sp.]